MIEGLADLEKRFRSIPRALHGALVESGRLMRDETRKRTPVDSRALKKSIKVVFEKDGNVGRAIIQSFDLDPHYDWWVEAGTGIYGPEKATWLAQPRRVMVFTSRKTGKRIRFRGQKPKWMFRYAYQDNIANVILIFNREIDKI